ncbi:MAG: hypothetical protein A2820_01330 [Candidatus Buchananbacteria bacterium RIFCSPHIGHO2_01_FULL_40_35]|nr:MAG: hypothetical protein A2820_01330 [Candidatus Buchananbacteria bacterium RIFCSPHIGHO2_01_FULL_40_35]
MTRKKYQRRIDFDQVISDSISDRELNIRETPLASNVPQIILISFTLIALVFLGTTGYLSVVKGSSFKARSESNINQDIPLIAPRGIILDRNGIPLVENAAIFTVFLQLDEMIRNDEKDIVLTAAEEILGLNKEEVGKQLEDTNLTSVTDIILKRDITRDQVIAIETLKTKSLIVENDFKRNYSNPAFSHAVGYVNSVTSEDLRTNEELALNDFIGRAGLEAYYDNSLRGENGRITIYRNAFGDLEDIKRTREPVAGSSLKTTIDAEFQEYFYDRMSLELKSLGRFSGVGLAINPENGEVLTLMSFPSFDANNISDYLSDPNQPLFNRAVSGAYSPGSAIKPVHAVAALKEGVVNPDTQIYSAGYIEIPNPYNPDNPSRFVDWKAHGWVNLRKALAVSSNVYFYEVGGGFENITGVGIEKLQRYWEKFGFGRQTGIDLPGEVAGFLPSPEEKEERTGSIWRVGDTYNVSIGQGDLRFSPVELLNGISAIAEGRAFKLHIAEQDDSEEIINLDDFSESLPEVREGMKDVVRSEYGSAKLLGDLPVKVAGKTGTPQTTGNTKINAIFVAYAPADDPKIAVLVLIEDAREGSLNAVPIARDVLGWYYENRLK